MVDFRREPHGLSAGLRFFSFSREEPRLHFHVIGPRGEAKFWLELELELAGNIPSKTKSTDEAEERARKKVEEEMEHEYLNEHKERMCWRFCRVLTVQDLAELYAGRKVLKEVARPARLERATFGF